MMEKMLNIVFCHLVGDYVLQSAYIANSKGKNWYHLLVHCVLYTLPFYLCFGLGWQYPVLLVSHFVIDARKARYDKLSYTQDQLLHYLIGLMYLV